MKCIGGLISHRRSYIVYKSENLHNPFREIRGTDLVSRKFQILKKRNSFKSGEYNDFLALRDRNTRIVYE